METDGCHVRPTRRRKGARLWDSLCYRMQATLVRAKLYIADLMNSTFFELIIARLQDPSTIPSWTVPCSLGCL